MQDLRYIVLRIATRVAFTGWLILVLSVMKDTALVLCIAGLIYYVMSLVVARLGARVERRWQEND